METQSERVLWNQFWQTKTETLADDYYILIRIFQMGFLCDNRKYLFEDVRLCVRNILLQLENYLAFSQHPPHAIGANEHERTIPTGCA